ncbi:MAG TPA: fumarylacetoacetate hydrolase family protein [Streptosporangiaceae bacterium]|nr:fumarylacetoacetate hydrolase family protein [Streptosporangiaceae bacterium]
MRLASFDGRVGVVQDGTITDITPMIGGTGGHGLSAMRRLIAAWPDVGAARLDLAGAPVSRLEDTRLSAPVPDPSKIVAAPVNYRDHQSEMNQDTHVAALGFFLKAPSSVLRPGGSVDLPYSDRRFDQEGELGVVIGRRARRVGAEDALDHVFGYTGLLDITMRGGEDRSTRKSFETFTPTGPWIVTAGEFGRPDDVDLRCWVNGQLRQQANTRDLIWSVAQLISYASWVTTLEPGDIVATGTPAGVGPLHAGDTIELELARLGQRLRVDVTSEHPVPSHTEGKGRGPVPPAPPAP